MEGNARLFGTLRSRMNALADETASDQPETPRIVSTSIGSTIFEPGNGALHTPFDSPDDQVHLWESELDCLRKIAEGKSNNEIAATRSKTDRPLAEKTVKSQLTDGLFPKLGVNNRTHAVVLGLRKGFLTMSDLVDVCPFPSTRERADSK